MLSILRTIFIDDYLVKLFSIVLAVFVWMYVSSQRSTVADLTVYLTIIAPDNAILNTPEKTTFTIKVQGPSDSIERLQRPYEVIHKELPLQGEFLDTYITMDAAKLGLPEGVNLVSSVMPIRMSLDQRVTMSLPVIPETTGTPAEGYSAKIVRAEPDQISVSGPKRLISELSELITDPIDLTGRTLSFDTLVRVNVESKYEGFIVENRLIKVFVRVQPIIIEREFLVPVMVTSDPQSRFVARSVTPDKVKIIVRGPQGVIERMNGSEILVSVYADSLSTAGIHTDVLTSVLLPGEVELVGLAPRVEIFLVDKIAMEKTP